MTVTLVVLLVFSVIRQGDELSGDGSFWENHLLAHGLRIGMPRGKPHETCRKIPSVGQSARNFLINAGECRSVICALPSALQTAGNGAQFPAIRLRALAENPPELCVHASSNKGEVIRLGSLQSKVKDVIVRTADGTSKRCFICSLPKFLSQFEIFRPVEGSGRHQTNSYVKVRYPAPGRSWASHQSSNLARAVLTSPTPPGQTTAASRVRDPSSSTVVRNLKTASAPKHSFRWPAASSKVCGRLRCSVKNVVTE